MTVPNWLPSRIVAVALPALLWLGACGGSGNGNDPDSGTSPDSGSPTTPMVTANTPSDGAGAVPRNGTISATFSEAMDPASLTTSSFTLTSGGVSVEGTVVYSSQKAFFRPSAYLASNATFTATITAAARSSAGVTLTGDHSWDFSTSDVVAPQLPVSLEAAGDFVILAKSAISTVPTSAISGDIAVSPSAATYITGFDLIADTGNTFASSTQVTGSIYAADYAAPTPSTLTTAVSAMELAYADAAGRVPDVTELGGGDVGGRDLAPGVYQWGTGLLIPTDVTLTGSATDVWIFQIAGDLTVSAQTSVLLAGGALPKHIFWQVAGAVELGTTAHVEGVILSSTAITLRTGSSVNGRLMAQTAVSLESATVVEPAP